jgi:hypothetical protein
MNGLTQRPFDLRAKPLVERAGACTVKFAWNKASLNATHPFKAFITVRTCQKSDETTGWGLIAQKPHQSLASKRPDYRLRIRTGESGVGIKHKACIIYDAGTSEGPCGISGLLLDDFSPIVGLNFVKGLEWRD